MRTVPGEQEPLLIHCLHARQKRGAKVLTVKNGGHEMRGAALLVLKIYWKLKAHWHPILSRLDQKIIFNSKMTPITPSGCVKAIWPRRVMSQVTWLSHPMHCPKHKRDGLGWDAPQTKGKQASKCSASLGTPSRMMEKPFQVAPQMPKSVQSSKGSNGCCVVSFYSFNEKLQSKYNH